MDRKTIGLTNPTHADILHSRKATKNITEFVIPINDKPFLFVDVGGQRSQRKKRFPCFDSIISILFLVSSSEFHHVLLEDRKTSIRYPGNRLEESRDIFDTIINNRIFINVSNILFLNKYDLLAKKVANPETDIPVYFSQFSENSHSLQDVQAFILSMFTGVKRRPKQALYHHFTTAVDTENMKVVFISVKDTKMMFLYKKL
ncbi:hypothetical protein WA026_019405 [Henosepilachna vigintioctopunctata]|uniref:G protein alpha subunit n=1 Tax=Henosepilachna vigintioctopunctata TaxID=420089 RepID=A0AAW1U9Z8_9CUCU